MGAILSFYHYKYKLLYFINQIIPDIFSGYLQKRNFCIAKYIGTPYLVVIKPHSNAIPKLRNVPARTYSVFAVSVSLNLSMDFAAIIKPIASYCPMIQNIAGIIEQNQQINAIGIEI